MSTASTPSGLTPSQAIRSSSGTAKPGNRIKNNDESVNAKTAKADNSNKNKSSDESMNKTGTCKGNRGRQRKRNKQKNFQAPPEGSDETAPPPTKTSTKQQRGAKKTMKGNGKVNNNNGNDGEIKGETNGQKKNPKRKNRNRKRYPWRKHIPPGTVDPITLENLASLSYPPFALRAAGPYLPVPEWPPKEEPQKDSQNNASQRDEEDAKERERRLLQEQWGKTVLSQEEDAKPPASQDNEEAVVNPKHLNLFDGRALAYYVVSQSQFIDPLNRRDLERDELCALDKYLRTHGFSELNVVEAYDTKGVSLSTAGAASTTAAGRMEMLQQEARVMLAALFGGQSAFPAARPSDNNRNNNNSSSNLLMQQYANYTAQEQQQQRGAQASQYSSSENNNSNTGYFMPGEGPRNGVYGDDDGGMLVVDDDANPNMRGASQGLRPYRSAQPPLGGSQATLWSSNRITAGSNAAALQPQNFPALSTAATLPPNQSPLNSSAPAFVPPGGGAPAPAAPARTPTKKKPLPPAKSLKFIAGAVKKTTAEEAQRQFEAREEARRKAMLSNLTFGSNPASWNYDETPQPPSSLPQATEGQMERNRAFADALGLADQSSKTAAKAGFAGWARPTSARDNIVMYTDDLILFAREKMPLLLKLERKWKTFLEDDKAASLPLNNMDRESRRLVHEYGSYYKLHTESFDPEPKRYVHCVKLLDTSVPYPLLSDAARQWRGPTGTVASYEHASQQTAGQDTWGRSPVALDLPKEPLASNPRAAALASGRPKLELKERTLPLELPPFQPPAPAPVETKPDDLLRRRQTRIEDQKRKEQEKEERKKKVLEDAFASDDEEECLGELDADSDWEEGEELYAGSDEGEET